MKPDMPEEDNMLPKDWLLPKRCQHDWTDLYNGTGVDRANPDRQWVYFFCQKCLEMRLKSYDQSMMRLNEDLEAERDAN